MPYDPNLPQENTLIDAAQMRAQLQALNADTQTRVTQGELAAAIAGTSNNSNAVGTLGQGADSSYNQTQIQDILNKLDELINALRR
ncbi:MAG: hypothetical protein WCF18_05110 [Chthoniobacteraceae bacterium]